MTSSVTDANLEKKFKAVTNTQDSIQTLSLWILHHKVHHKKIVDAWMKVLQKAKISHRLALFYLANDVIQNGKRKNVPQFGNSFAEVFREATLLVRDEKIKPNVERVFNIWEQRDVYESDFISDLKAILANTKVPASAPAKLLNEFKHESVIEKLRIVVKLQMETASKIATINLGKLNANNAEIVQQLKDRMHGQQFSRDFDDSTNCLEELIKSMNKEIKERTDLILKLEQSEIYYDTQRGEAKIVANAYKNFGIRVKGLQKKLEDLMTTFPSPVPSPCPDAPSPTISEVEMQLSLPNDSVEANDLENAPSPVGSPEGLNLSPPNQEPRALKQDLGNPIPTVSNIFSQEQSGMTSWLDTFSKKKKAPVTPSAEPKKQDPSSLDSRLSNLLQNIPNLPAGLQNTLFASSMATANNSQDEEHSTKQNKMSEVAMPHSNSPTKEDGSGQNTPLQDEDSHSANQATFFSRLASSNKTHSPKEILKGLTNLINASGGTPEQSDHRRKDTYSSYSRSHKRSDSPSDFYDPLTSPITTVPIAGTTYQSSAFDDMSSFVSSNKNINEHMSFIPSLVPSNPLDDGGFDYSTESYHHPLDEYNPEIENFDVDMDIESDLGLGDHDVPSPEMMPGNDTRSPTPEMTPSRVLGGRRLSTLITVVTEDEPEDQSSSKPYLSNMAFEMSKDTEKQNVSDWPVTGDVPKDVSDVPTNSVEPSPDEPDPSPEEFPHDQDLRTQFFPANPSPPTVECPPTNGPLQTPLVESPSGIKPNRPMSKIETVHSHRKDFDGRQEFDKRQEFDNRQEFNNQQEFNNRQFGNNDWIDYKNDRVGSFGAGDQHQREFFPPPQPYMFENKRGRRNSNFYPRNNNWVPRGIRPVRNSFDHHRNNHPYGPPQHNRFPFRGRGWGYRQPQY